MSSQPKPEKPIPKNDEQSGRFPIWGYIAAGIVIIAIFFGAVHFKDNPRMILIIQALSSSWSPPNQFNDITIWEYAGSAVFAIIINWGTLIAAFVLIYNYISKLILHEVSMAKVKHFLELEEAALKVALLKRLGTTPDNKKLLAEAFKEVAEAKDSMIEGAFGKKSAAAFKKLLDKDI